MAAGGDDYSQDLDEARKLLFPNLSQEEGRARVDAAIARAQDESRIDRVDRLAVNDLYTVLLSLLRQEREQDD